MTKEEIDILWNKALRESVDDGTLYTRYRFAELIAEAERNRTWTQDHWTEYERSIAAAAKAEEREACAKVCEYAISSIWEFHPEYVNQVGKNVCTNLAAAIRARSNT